eukprot:3413914-Pleurochrysis_carterae.AAC.2
MEGNSLVKFYREGLGVENKRPGRMRPSEERKVAVAVAETAHDRMSWCDRFGFSVGEDERRRRSEDACGAMCLCNAGLSALVCDHVHARSAARVRTG